MYLKKKNLGKYVHTGDFCLGYDRTQRQRKMKKQLIFTACRLLENSPMKIMSVWKQYCVDHQDLLLTQCLFLLFQQISKPETLHGWFASEF